MSPFREIEHIRNSAESLKKEAEGATGEERRLLLRSVDELERLAARVKPGSVTPTKETAHLQDISRSIDGIFARAHHALARQHHLKAKTSWDKGKALEAAHELKAAATHLQQGLVWVEHTLEDAGARAITTAHRLGQQLIAGSGAPPADVGTGIDALGGDIEKLGRKAESLTGP